MMTPYRILLSACSIAVAAGCTPLGLWVYDDPGLEVSRVRLKPKAGDAHPVVLGLAVLNPNDYDLMTARFELQLRLDGVPIGYFSRDSIFPLPKFGVIDLTLPLTPSPSATRERLHALSSGTHQFAVAGLATFKTPFGPHEVRFAHEGAMVFGGASTAKPDSNLAGSSGSRRGSPGSLLPDVRIMPIGAGEGRGEP